MFTGSEETDVLRGQQQQVQVQRLVYDEPLVTNLDPLDGAEVRLVETIETTLT